MHIVCTLHSSLCMHSTVSCITCMHFECFKEKHCTLIVFHNRIFPKNWGGQMHYWPPNPFLGGGGMAPLAPTPPVADPMTLRTIRTLKTLKTLKTESKQYAMRNTWGPLLVGQGGHCPPP